MSKNVELANAQERHRQHPDTFAVPAPQWLRAITVGDNVKVCAGRERFWCVVTEREGDQITAQVNNQLVLTHEHGLVAGDVLHCTVENVLDIEFTHGQNPDGAQEDDAQDDDTITLEAWEAWLRRIEAGHYMQVPPDTVDPQAELPGSMDGRIIDDYVDCTLEHLDAFSTPAPGESKTEAVARRCIVGWLAAALGGLIGSYMEAVAAADEEDG
jgi:hypothetical protein